jgi:hypothetical protein
MVNHIPAIGAPNSMMRRFQERPQLAVNLLVALEDAEEFIRGFEDDPVQDGIDGLLAIIRNAIAAARGIQP